jgi:hypothetical protein
MEFCCLAARFIRCAKRAFSDLSWAVSLEQSENEFAAKSSVNKSAKVGLVRLRIESFVPIIPEPAVYQVLMTEGRRLWVPRKSDQCWAHELPCTPYVNWAVLARVRWPAAWPYRYDPPLEPPQDWTPASGVYPKSH